jgi:hypothetical protein
LASAVVAEFPGLADLKAGELGVDVVPCDAAGRPAGKERVLEPMAGGLSFLAWLHERYYGEPFQPERAAYIEDTSKAAAAAFSGAGGRVGCPANPDNQGFQQFVASLDHGYVSPHAFEEGVVDCLQQWQ